MEPKIFHESIANYYKFIITVLNESMLAKKMIIDKGLKDLPLEEKEKEEIKQTLLEYIELLESAINTTHFLSKGFNKLINPVAKTEKEEV